MPRAGVEVSRLTDRPRILVVDDDPTITQMLVIAFRTVDVEVERAHRAFGLLNLIAERRPHLVLLDAMMPGLDGPSVTELIRQDPELSTTQILLYSAMDEASLQKATRLCGADGCIMKTVGPVMVVEEVMRRLRAG